MNRNPSQLKPQRLRLPEHIRACLFDMDGVLTKTAAVHASAWKAMFDAYLQTRAQHTNEPFVPFEIATDYTSYVDGKLREDGVRSFLASRGIELPEGQPDDPPERESVHGLGNRKNQMVLALIQRDGVETYSDTIRFLDVAHNNGYRTAVVSASKNTIEVLQVTGLTDKFDSIMHGGIAAERNLPGKPAPDTYLAAAAELGVSPKDCVVLEDAISGVQAGKAGGFGYVIGVDRVHQRETLLANGATIVTDNLEELIETS